MTARTSATFRQAADLLAGAAVVGQGRVEQAGLAAVELTEGLGLHPEQQLAMTERLLALASVAGVVLRGLNSGRYSLGVMLDMAADQLAARDAQEGGPDAGR